MAINNELMRRMKKQAGRRQPGFTPKVDRYVDVDEPEPSSPGKGGEYQQIAKNLEQAGWKRATPQEMEQAGVSGAAREGEWWSSGNTLVMMTADGAQGARMLPKAQVAQPERASQRPAPTRQAPTQVAPPTTPAARTPKAPVGPMRGDRMAGGGPQLDVARAGAGASSVPPAQQASAGLSGRGAPPPSPSAAPAGRPVVPPATQAALAPSNGRPQPSLANMGAAAMRGRAAGAPQLDATPRQAEPPTQFMPGEEAYPSRRPSTPPTSSAPTTRAVQAPPATQEVLEDRGGKGRRDSGGMKKLVESSDNERWVAGEAVRSARERMASRDQRVSALNSEIMNSQGGVNMSHPSVKKAIATVANREGISPEDVIKGWEGTFDFKSRVLRQLSLDEGVEGEGRRAMEEDVARREDDERMLTPEGRKRMTAKGWKRYNAQQKPEAEKERR